MAILFNCPYCTAPIRVPDTASGKQGSCPQCGTKLLVPRVEVPPNAATPTANAPSGHRGNGDDGFPALEPEDALQHAQSLSVAKKLRRRQRARRTRPTIPLVFGGALVVVIAVLLWQHRASLTGQLEAVALAETVLEPRLVPAPVKLRKTTVTLVLAHLAKQPVRLKSPSMEVELQGTPRGIQVSVRETSTTRFFRVDVSANALLRDYLPKHVGKLNGPRDAALQANTRTFFRQWERAVQQHLAVEGLSGYRNKLGLTALVGGLGYNVEAVLGRQLYRCVYEDSQGRLYFLLPKNTQSFKIQGRQLPDRRTLFPGHFTVKVTKVCR